MSDLDYWNHPTNSERIKVQQKDYLLGLSKDLDSRPEILIFGSKEWIIKRFQDLSSQLISTKEAGKLLCPQDQAHFIYREIIPFLQGGIKSMIYVIVAFKPDYFNMPISELTFLESSVEDAFQRLMSFRRNFSTSLILDLFRVRNLFECIDWKSPGSTMENSEPYISHANGMKIEVKNLTFRYHKDGKDVLKNVNFTIERGQIVSIVGYNGSGTIHIAALI